jgi:HlyD family secretion protein
MMKHPVLKFVLGAALIAAAAAAYYWWQGRDAGPVYRFGGVDRGTVTSVIAATGTVNPVVSVQVGSQVSGQVKEIYVDYNSQVKKGDLVARIDPESFQLRVNQAMADVEAARANVLTQRANVAALQAEVSRAKVNLGEAQRELERNRMLAEKNFISTAVLERSETALALAQEQVKIAQAQHAVAQAHVRNVEALVNQREAQLAQARVDFERTAIRAPVDGIVVKKSVEPGQTVAASLQAPELFVIAQDLRDMQVDASIDEAEVGRLRPGQAATFTVDSFPGRVYRGKVSQVRKAAQVVQNVVTYTAVIATANPDLSLFPGMTANVRIVIDSRDGVLRIPNAALRYRPAGAAQPREAAQAEAGTASAAERPGKGAGGQGGQALRERLTRELKLDAAQQAKLEAIQNETRDRIRALAIENPAERRKQVERLRAESRTRIAEILNVEQRARFEAMGGASRPGGGATTGRVWVLDEKGQPRAVQVRIGLTDGTHSEIMSNELQEGMRVIVGAAASARRPQPAGGPRMAF